MPAELSRFEDFELDPSAYRLRRKGRLVHLERIPLELLSLLVARRGELVTREEILERVWGKGIFIDSENSINTAVRKIRRALNDDAVTPRFIVTIPSRGYRFVAPIQRESVAASPHLRSGLREFVGRERERTQLEGGLENARLGRGGLFLVAGAPGVGKTRLADEVASLAHARGMAVIVGRCSEQDAPFPYLPFVEILESCVDRAANPERVRSLLGAQGPEMTRLLPKLRRILPDLEPPLELPPHQARRYLFTCFGDFLARFARTQPALLMLDDLHWADDSSLALLDHLVRRLSDLPLLIVGTYRDVELDLTRGFAKTLENLLRGRLLNPIRLKGLPRDDVAQLLRGLSGQSPPATVVGEIHAETEGNPFFVEELFRHLEEENRLYDAAGQFRAELKIGALEVPASVRLVVGRRLARLSDLTQKMLATAATIGRSFAFEVLQASTISESDRLLEYIEEAEKAGLIFSSAESPETHLEFSHELIRQAVLSSLLEPRRRQLHLSVADAIELVYRDRLEDHCGELAHHCSAGGNAPKAVEYLLRAGQQAAQRFALHEAVVFFKRGLELLQKLPDDEHRIREELKLQRALAQAWWTLHVESPEARSAMLRTLELCERLGDKREIFVALNSTMSMYLDKEVRLAREFAERELVLAQQVGEPAMLAHAHAAAMGHTMVLQGEFVTAREHLEKGLAIPGSQSPWAQSPGWSLLAWDLWLLGYPDQALNHLAKALAATEKESEQFWRSSGWFYALRVYVCLRHPQTLDLASTMLAYVTERKLYQLAGIAPLFVEWALAEQGRTVEAAAIFDRRTKETRPANSIPGWVYLMAGEINAKAGNMGMGLSVVASGLRICDETGELSHKADLHRLNGDLLLMQDAANAAWAEGCFRTAIEIARGQSAKSWELRATMSLARLLASQDRRDEARAMLAEIYGWFTEGFDTADLKDAQALRDELSG
jgi:DNA-binding winged helix-turn-helix (wHTH) protein/tetratricopeptide (TPR) repeat protein